MDCQAAIQATTPLSLAEYASGLAKNGVRTLPGAPGSFWIQHEIGAMMRVPTFHCTPPSVRELRRIFWRGGAAVVSYVLEADDRHPANAWLYVCHDRAYALDNLPPAVRRNVRRGLKELTITPITLEQVLAYGLQAFNDTLRRIGLNGGGPEEFYRSFTWRAKFPGHAFLGAWKDDQLAAFLSITEVADWVEIEGGCSMDVWLNLRPNDALLFHALSYYLASGRCQLVSYGLSSIQASSNEAGLHMFKTKVGFEARPVHRVLRLHPLLRPFANRLARWGIDIALRFRPGNRRLQKAEGVLAYLLGEKRLTEVVERSMSHE